MSQRLLNIYFSIVTLSSLCQSLYIQKGLSPDLPFRISFIISYKEGSDIRKYTRSRNVAKEDFRNIKLRNTGEAYCTIKTYWLWLINMNQEHSWPLGPFSFHSSQPIDVIQTSPTIHPCFNTNHENQIDTANVGLKIPK